MTVSRLYTIGHSNGTLDHLLHLLSSNGINVIADVRSQPYSGHNPQFNRTPLCEALTRLRISYLFLGRELGARPEDPSCYRNGRAQYSLIARTSLFERGIRCLEQRMASSRLAILCAEKEPLACHRTLLISRYLFERNVSIHHILHDGSVEDHASTINRLLGLLGMQESNLFYTREEVVELAYERQAECVQFAGLQDSCSSD